MTMDVFRGGNEGRYSLHKLIFNGESIFNPDKQLGLLRSIRLTAAQLSNTQLADPQISYSGARESLTYDALSRTQTKRNRTSGTVIDLVTGH